MQYYHTSVMAKEVLDNLIVNPDGTYLDGTLGGGGHTELILKKLSPNGQMIGLDRDAEAINWCRQKFMNDPRLHIYHKNFSHMEEAASEGSLSGVLLDLGVSSRQLDSSSRGFSFSEGQELDMRMDRSQEFTALDYISQTPEEEISLAFRKNSDLEKSRQLASALKKHVSSNPSSGAMLQAVKEVFPKGERFYTKYLARIAQAIRIEVNSEKLEVEKGLESSLKLLKKGGRLCVITFHSVEDRWVKKITREWEKDCNCPKEWPICRCGGNNKKIKRVFKKPLEPSAEEIKNNPRSRSAKLRVLEKIK